MWFWYALLSAICFGVGPVLVKSGQKDLPPLVDNVIATFFAVFVVALGLFIYGVDIGAVGQVFPFAFIVAVTYMTYYYVISKGRVSLTTTIMSASPAVTAILGIIFLGEGLGFVQIASVSLVVVGTIMLDYKQISRKWTNVSLWVWWGLLGALMIGTAEVVTRYATRSIDANSFTFVMALCYLPALLLCVFIDKQGRERIKSINFGAFKNSLIGVGLVELGLIPYNLAFSLGNAAWVSTVAASRIVITVVLAAIFLKERIDNLQKVGIGIILGGVVLSGFLV